MMSEEAARIARWEKRVRKKEKMEARLERNRAWLMEYKLTQMCAECNESDPEKLTFHHRDPSTKTKNVASMIDRSIPRIQKEIEKCIVLCETCHKNLHEEEKQNDKEGELR